MRSNIVLILCLCLVFSSCSERVGNDSKPSPVLDSLIDAADKLSGTGNKAEALSMIQSAHSRLEGLSIEDEIKYYTFCNIIYNHANEHDNSILIADSMLAVLEHAEDNPKVTSWKTVAYNIKADALFAKGNYNDAYNYYHVAQMLATKTNDSCALRTYSYRLAMTLYKQQRFREAAEKFKTAHRQSMVCGDNFNLFYFRQELLDNIGLCYNALKTYDSAIVYYNKALSYLDENTGKFENKLPNVFEAPKAVVYGNLAEVYVNLGKYDSAKDLYKLSININLQKGYTNSDAIVDQAKLADLYFRTGDTGVCKRTLDLIKAELDTIPDKRVEMLWNKLMWRYYDESSNAPKAYAYLRTYSLQNEALINSNKALMETDLEMRVRDMEKQYKINLLTNDKKQQKIYNIVVTIIALMAFAIIFLVLRNASRSQKNIKVLTDLNNRVNEQKAKLEVAIEELRKKERDKSRILKSVAHDVMSPISSIVSLADILLHDEKATLEERIEILNLIKEASSNSLSLSKDILEASREMEESPVDKEKSDINMLVAKAVELLNFRALDKKQQIVTNYPPQHIYAWVYKDKIRRVINNLLSNAIKFSHPGSVITINLENAAGNVHISVKDTGIGIPDKNKAHVFDMFTDAKMPGTAGEIPHGLGLSISRQIVQLHRGDIWFESEEGHGTTFHVVFPIETTEAAS
jgi:signal transduction histidine kinase/Tfp pilus assembly protein PilF